MNSNYKDIPQIEILLKEENINCFIKKIGHTLVVKILREEVADFRGKIKSGNPSHIDELYRSIEKRCQDKNLEKLQRVINGTGVILHTNLGRSPLSEEILDNLKNSLAGYCNLEMHLPSEKRGKRGGMAEELICNLTGAEDALIVNNNASSVFLILKEYASEKEVIVSRSELIQIGGGFRIPDIMDQTGAKLVEVGTTNITDLDDYKNAITDSCGMIFSAHQSNYSINGFTRNPSLKELSSLKNESILFVRDLGSGNLVNDKTLPQPFEPLVSHEMSQGADIICFSGDKLLGGPQAGIIIGKKKFISQLRKNPLMRMIRVDKITYFLLQETLLNYSNSKIKDVPLWDIVLQDKKDLSKRRDIIYKKIKHADKKECIKKCDTKNTFGGGTLPSTEMESLGLQIDIEDTSPEKIYSEFIRMKIPIVGIIINDLFTIDISTVLDRDIEAVAESIDLVLKKI